MAFNISPNMSLPVPVVGNEIGPNYAFDINCALALVDSHDHSPGKGVQITPAGLNINSNLSFQSNYATNMGAIVFSAISPITTLQALYVAPGVESPADQDLWFNDGNGNAVQLTSNGAVNATIASIPGESYAAGTFYWKQGALSTTPANFDIGSITIRPTVSATAFGVTVSPPAGISSAYNVALPNLPVSATSLLTMDTGGNTYATTVPDGSTIAITGGVLKVPNGGIGSTQIAAGGVQTSNLAANAVTYAKIDPALLEWNNQTFTSSGSFTVPAGVNRVYVEMSGGGGGGGGGANSGGGFYAAPGGGGGAGALPNKGWLDVSPSQVLTIAVGAGGTAGTAGASGGSGGTNGGSGGTSSVSSGATLLMNAPGALGGNGGNSGSNIGGTGGSNPTAGSSSAGAAGVLVAIQIAFAGQAGGNGGGADYAGGAGGSGSGFYCPGFTGGAGGTLNTSRGGGGGGGCSATANGGNGSNGGAGGSAGAGSSGSGGGGRGDCGHGWSRGLAV